MTPSHRYIVNFPWIVLLAALMLTGIGLLGIYSATLTTGADGQGRGSTTVLVQCVWLVVSLGAVALVVWPSYLKLGRYSYALFGVSLVALAVLLVARATGGIPGLVTARNGAYSWFTIPGTRNTLQPSELTKIAFIMALAHWLAYRKDYRRARGLIVPFLIALVPTAMVIRQPDLGTALVFLPVLVLMLVAAGARLRHLLAVAGVALLLAPVAYLKIDPFQQRRIESWIIAGPVEAFRMRRQGVAPDEKLSDPEKIEMVADLRHATGVRVYAAMDYAKWWTGRHVSWLFGSARLRRQGYYDRAYASPLAGFDDSGGSVGRRFLKAHWFVEKVLTGPGYQPHQAKVAVGSGGLGGLGMCRGSQTQNGFLAEARSDFIFAVIAEEWGFVGSLIVLVLLLVIILFGVDVGLSTNEPYGKLLAVGVVAMISAQAFLNIAICTGLMPVTGIPLPLVSYGGSSLVSAYIAIGLLCNVGMRRYVLDLPQPFQFKD